MQRFFLLLFLLTAKCETGNLKIIMDLPIDLNEASGLAIDQKNHLLWMVNDSGNKPILYGLNGNGDIAKALKIKAKNRDWEDLTMDPLGNIYIGDFGNNENDSKKLSILKVSKDSLNNFGKIDVEKTTFTYPEQTKFPPKKKKRHFDCEAFFFFKDSLYLFTKSRDPKNIGKTNLYQLPTKVGNYKAKYLGSYNTCIESECWVTSADINSKGTKVALLTENSVYVFTDFKGANFFNGKVKQIPFTYSTQKESVAFKNDSLLYITDEYLGIDGGNLYELKI